MPSFTATTSHPSAPQIPYDASRKTLELTHTGTSDGDTVTTNRVHYDFTGDQQGAALVGVRILANASKYFNVQMGDDPRRAIYLQSVGGDVVVEYSEAH